MSSPRWITPDETKELMDRARRLLRQNGYTYDGEPGEKLAEAKLGQIRVVLDVKERVFVHDFVADVLVFDFKTGGIREVYGSTARNALLYLREAMVLEDLADV